MTTTIRQPTPTLLAAIAVAAAVALPATVAMAQYQVQTGRTNDANNRIGSGGYNVGFGGNPYAVTGNDIVYGNVTGGKAFSGPVPYGDPAAFRGQGAGIMSDRFIRNSSGAVTGFGTGGSQRPTYGAPQPFFGESRAVPPPPGYVRDNLTGGFVASTNVQPRIQPYDTRMSADIIQSPENISAVRAPQPGEFVLPGQVDPASPQLNAARQMRLGQPAFPQIQSDPSSPSDPSSAGNAMPQLDYSALQRREGYSPLSISRTTAERVRGAMANDQAADGASSDARLNQLNAPFDAPDLAALDDRLASQPLSGGINTQQSIRQRLLTAPQQQSTQYAELRQRLERYYGEQQKTDADHNREFRRQLAEQQQQQQQQQEQQDQTTGVQPVTPRDLGVQAYGDRAKEILSRPAEQSTPLVAQGRAGSVTAIVPTTPKPDPLDVTSLAEGVQAEGLRNTLAQAEELMKDGKYSSAIERYESAAEIAPNQPLVLLGQSNAELGAGFYARAENHLRQAFLLDPTLLMGRYDLGSFLGEQRLQFLIRDLKDIARKEPTQSRPVFLLAYIAYNTGHPDRAASYLDLAERRHQTADPVFRLLRSHWKLELQPGQNPEDILAQ